MKRIVIIGDGMSDYPAPELDGGTPLMAAHTPAMDRIARQGRCGIFRTIEPDQPTGSAVANLAVLGYDPAECFQGRGVLEAASLGVELAPDDLALRVNLVHLDGERMGSHSAGHISNEEAAELIAACADAFGSEGFRFHLGLSYRHLLVLPGGDPRLECFPPHDHVGEPVAELRIRPLAPEAEATAAALNALVQRSRKLLEEHPVNRARQAAGKPTANALWPWSPGRRPRMATLQERFGISGAVISAVDLVKGLGVYAGMEVIPVPGATGLHDTNYEGKADACLEALARHDLVYVHVEASDEAGHARDLELKIRCIEYLDRRLIQRVLDGLEQRGIRAVVAVLPDHATPVALGIHVRDPVPVAVWDPRRRPDGVSKYDEESVLRGALGELRGAAFIETVLADPEPPR
jgi:2,3-bisphosphoglycerate-independent phosphoglycerate mutase